MNSSSTIPARARRAAPRRPAAPRPTSLPLLRSVRAALQDHERVERVSRTFRALGDPTRSRLVLALSVTEMYPSDLAEVLGASLSAVSHQLRILRDLDIVRVRRRGRRQLYALNESAFGFCAPRVCHAWRQTLATPETPRAGGRR